MTKYEKDIAWLLLQPDHYMIVTTNVHGKTIFKVYDAGKQPVQYFYERQVKKFTHLFKTDHHNRVTLNLTEVRKLRGSTYIKMMYKKYRIHGKN